jgi:hypothetical protein
VKDKRFTGRFTQRLALYVDTDAVARAFAERIRAKSAARQQQG